MQRRHHLYGYDLLGKKAHKAGTKASVPTVNSASRAPVVEGMP